MRYAITDYLARGTRSFDKAAKPFGIFFRALDQFRAQLALLFSEQKTKQALLDKAQATQQRLHGQLVAMLAQSTKIDMALSEIGPRIAIAKAAQALEELDGIIASVDAVSVEVLDGSRQLTEDYNPIGTTRELLESARQQQIHQPTAQGDVDFQAYLAERQS